jgi:hypothetical protein
VSGDIGSQRDLIVVVADADAEQAVRALLARPRSLEIRTVLFEVRRFVKRDSGCFGESHELLRSFQKQFRYALVVFDRQGCGREHTMSRQQIESDVEGRLARNGWADRSAAVVLDPELEAWVWSKSPVVAEVLGWHSRHHEFQAWLDMHGGVSSKTGKPADPKALFHEALRLEGVRRSPSLFQQLAGRVTLLQCTDPSFAKFRDTLQHWFPPGDGA